MNMLQNSKQIVNVSLVPMSVTFDADALRKGLAPIASFEAFLESCQASCSLELGIKETLELLDPVLEHDISLKVSVSNVNLKVRLPDLIQILGHMILHTVDFVGQAGEIRISANANEGGSGVSIQVLGRRLRSGRSDLLDLVTRSLELATSERATTSLSAAPKLPSGLKGAQKVAERYRASLEYQLPSGEQTKVRVTLPML